MISIPHETFVCHAHIQRAHDTEGQQGVTWNPDIPAAILAAKSANDGPNNTIIVASRFEAVRRRSYRVTLAIHSDRIQVENQITVRSNPRKQLHA
jgi:hypothetical protein